MNDNGLRIHDGRSRMDKAIDHAVRDMMSVDPPPGLRRRVLARLNAPPARSSFGWQLAFAAASVAVLLLAIALWRAERPAVPVPADVRASVDSAPQTTPPPVTSQLPVPAAPSAASTGATREGRGAERPRIRVTNPFAEPQPDRISAASAEPGANSVAPSPEPRAGALVPPRPLDIPALTIKPISVEPLQLAPLSPPR